MTHAIGTRIDVSPAACIAALLAEFAESLNNDKPFDKGVIACLDMYRRTCPAVFANALSGA